ncbi:MAG: preprotein translocase subunit YajC [Selenomonadales bacterium]|nr:preprotein translocase subunit YajC [Selenomonadales bacterium]
MVQTLVAYGPIVFMLIVFYFLLYRPQKKEQQARKNMLLNLKKGNKVITVGGVYGTITEIKDDVVTIKIADKVDVQVARMSIANNMNNPIKVRGQK